MNNFLDLYENYQLQFDLEKKVEDIRTNLRNEVKLQRLLSTHLLQNDLTYTEGIFRDNLDLVLSFLSLIELGLVTSYFEIKDIDKDRLSLYSKILNNECIFKYYTYYYPQNLLLLLRYRLNVGRPFFTHTQEKQNSFSNFYNFVNYFYKSKILDFAWLLDDGISDNQEIDLEDFLFFLTKKEKIIESFDKPENKKKDIDIALIGFNEFLKFSNDFDTFLEKNKDKFLNSLYWNFFGYWYNILSGSVLGVISYSIEHFRLKGKNDIFVNYNHFVLQKLSSGYYRFYLDDKIFNDERFLMLYIDVP